MTTKASASSPRRSKQLNISTAVSITNVSTPSLKRAQAMFFCDSLGNWVMELWISMTYDSSTGPEFHIEGILAKNVSNYHGNGSWMDNGAISHQAQCFVSPGTKDFVVRSPTAGSYFSSHMRIELNAEPTWSSLGTTKAAALEAL